MKVRLQDRRALALPAAPFNFAYVDDEGYGKYPPKTFADVPAAFTEYKG